MPEKEQISIRARILDCEERIANQRAEIVQMTTAGADTSSAINLLSAMECTQALRFRRLAALS
jgi:hypothetical protein